MAVHAASMLTVFRTAILSGFSAALNEVFSALRGSSTSDHPFANHVLHLKTVVSQIPVDPSHYIRNQGF